MLDYQLIGHPLRGFRLSPGMSQHQDSTEIRIKDVTYDFTTISPFFFSLGVTARMTTLAPNHSDSASAKDGSTWSAVFQALGNGHLNVSPHSIMAWCLLTYSIRSSGEFVNDAFFVHAANCSSFSLSVCFMTWFRTSGVSFSQQALTCTFQSWIRWQGCLEPFIESQSGSKISLIFSL